MTNLQSNQSVSSALHFHWHNFYPFVLFLITLPYHVIFHKQEYGHTIKGFILCDDPCGFCYDKGLRYGMHCEDCYNYIRQATLRRISS